jgi:hypothetical protein
LSDNKDEQIETPEELTKKYPSLTLSYEQVKDVLTEQEETAERLDNKIATLFAAATAVFGISIPFFFDLLDIGRISKLSLVFALSIGMILAFLVGASILSYINIVLLSLTAYKPRKFITMNNPTEMRRNLWQISNSEFIHEILVNTEIAFYKNDKQLKIKAKQAQELFLWIPAELLSIGGLIFIVFALH